MFKHVLRCLISLFVWLFLYVVLTGAFCFYVGIPRQSVEIINWIIPSIFGFFIGYFIAR